MKHNFLKDVKFKDIFDPGRFYLLLRRELVHHYRTLGIAAAFGFGALLILNILGGLANSSQHTHQTLFSMMLFWGGLILTSLSFTESHYAPQNYFYLTLPASTLEKYLSKLLLTSIGFIAVSLAGYFIVTVLVLTINLLVYRVSSPVFNPFCLEIARAIHYYLIANSIFLFGALFFRKMHFIKTSLSLFGFFSGLFLFTGLVVVIVFHEYLHQGLTGHLIIQFPAFKAPEFKTPWHDIFTGRFSTWGNIIINLIQFCVMFFTAPFFWILGYIRLKESEAGDGV